VVRNGVQGISASARHTRSSLLKNIVAALRRQRAPARGETVSCNTYIKALNAFCLWLHNEGHATERLALPLIRVEKRIVVTLTDAQIHTLLRHMLILFMTKSDHLRLNVLI
jgi:integrase